MFRRMMRLVFCLVIVVAAGAATMGPRQAEGARSDDYTDIPRSHWAFQAVRWSKINGVATGFSDGSFRPSQFVSEAEFLGMIFRAYPELPLDELEEGEPEYAPYYAYATKADWPVEHQPDAPVTRGQAARLLAALAGQSLPEQRAVLWMFTQEIAEGKSGEEAAFAFGDKLTRAEAVTFLYRLEKAQPCAVLSGPEGTASGISLNGLGLGDAESKVTELLGKPDRKDAASSGMEWYVYNRNYQCYKQIGLTDNRVVALFSNGGEWQFGDGNANGLDGLLDRAGDLWGEPEHVSDYELVYRPNGSYLHLYKNNERGESIGKEFVDGALWMDRSYVDALTAKTALFSVPLDALEREMFDLANTARVKRGVLGPLVWNEEFAAAARLHSQDMAKRNYVGVETPDGQTLEERLIAQGLGDYRNRGENIRVGNADAIAVYYEWVNKKSSGAEMLSGKFTMLGVGAAEGTGNSDYPMYYTLLFSKP
ncbi:hypothetical protein EHV15_07840 [Paenibacillus oralis]|uniref:SLH domain-containing protein n=1 Tax=Paenibacillus oralis TaxID=2490856 RepID=A0A3P3TYS5_9BACL|nr:CAP-associated domain-containing protein [Paenibacillus oralis]RRJ62856.1 hypothetical protein EHV15_07840 [Paenibacillus oralis]